MIPFNDYGEQRKPYTSGVGTEPAKRLLPRTMGQASIGDGPFALDIAVSKLAIRGLRPACLVGTGEQNFGTASALMCTRERLKGIFFYRAEECADADRRRYAHRVDTQLSGPMRVCLTQRERKATRLDQILSVTQTWNGQS